MTGEKVSALFRLGMEMYLKDSSRIISNVALASTITQVRDCVVLCVAYVGCDKVRIKHLSNFVEHVILSVCFSPPMKTENAILASIKTIPGLETASGFLRIGSRHFSSRAIPRA